MPKVKANRRPKRDTAEGKQAPNKNTESEKKTSTTKPHRETFSKDTDNEVRDCPPGHPVLFSGPYDVVVECDTMKDVIAKNTMALREAGTEEAKTKVVQIFDFMMAKVQARETGEKGKEFLRFTPEEFKTVCEAYAAYGITAVFNRLKPLSGAAKRTAKKAQKKKNKQAAAAASAAAADDS